MANRQQITAEMLIGGVMGALGAAFNQSAAGNLVSSAAASMLGSAISVWPMKTQEKFFSRETAVSALAISGGSVVSHLIVDAIIHRHHAKPTIVFAPDCNNSEKSWVAKTSQATEQAEMGR